jgi:four helix bundle protein
VSFKFEQLKVWEKAIQLSFDVHELTKQFPKSELFILTAQIKRATDSVSLNIAEGSTGQSNAEFQRFVGYAIRSAIEVVGCLYLGRGRGLIPDKDFKHLYNSTEELVRMLQSLRNNLR